MKINWKIPLKFSLGILQQVFPKTFDRSYQFQSEFLLEHLKDDTKDFFFKNNWKEFLENKSVGYF